LDASLNVLDIKEKRKILERKLKTKISAKPLSMHRIKYGKDLLMLKTKTEGLVLSGNNYLDKISIKNVNELPVDDVFSYFFSGVFI